jgi:hypothetical protein
MKKLSSIRMLLIMFYICFVNSLPARAQLNYMALEQLSATNSSIVTFSGKVSIPFGNLSVASLITANTLNILTSAQFAAASFSGQITTSSGLNGCVQVVNGTFMGTGNACGSGGGNGSNNSSINGYGTSGSGNILVLTSGAVLNSASFTGITQFGNAPSYPWTAYGSLVNIAKGTNIINTTTFGPLEYIEKWAGNVPYSGSAGEWDTGLKVVYTDQNTLGNTIGPVGIQSTLFEYGIGGEAIGGHAWQQSATGGSVWGGWFVAGLVVPNSTSATAFGIEIDIDNASKDAGYLYSPASANGAEVGLWINSTSAGSPNSPDTMAIGIAYGIQAGTPITWYSGLSITEDSIHPEVSDPVYSGLKAGEGVMLQGADSAIKAAGGIRFRNYHTTGIDFGNATISKGIDFGNATMSVGLDLNRATFTNYPMRLPNNKAIYFNDAAGNAQNMIFLGTGNTFSLGLGAAGGTAIGGLTEGFVKSSIYGVLSTDNSTYATVSSLGSAAYTSSSTYDAAGSAAGIVSTYSLGSLGSAAYTSSSGYLTPSGNGSSLTGLTQSQISGLTVGSTPTFAGMNLTTNLTMSNNQFILMKDSGGTAQNVMYYNTANELVLGAGSTTPSTNMVLEIAGVQCTLSRTTVATVGNVVVCN